ncbi:MAG: hypothetical protein VKL39_13795, partial [Leptolyngbyaceae bacterium]|nr:hypothetical protein [Leptolyngbyaceae bacterium]
MRTHTVQVSLTFQRPNSDGPPSPQVLAHELSEVLRSGYGDLPPAEGVVVVIQRIDTFPPVEG